MDALKVAVEFVAAINRHSVKDISGLMADNHRFIDTDGAIVEGRTLMKQGWNSYFEMVPDYKISVTETFKSGNRVMLLGEASGTFATYKMLKPENAWKTPAAWRVVVDDGKVTEWQVFADNKPIREIMRREGAL
ncbi:MAG: nuclear transport factor 2 family protein [candidate division Zixibacteria bacterium]|nr:nuclear transport factor 2 family protein [candidate division Zixibacteria bacterium]